jgi:hypothetical protein
MPRLLSISLILCALVLALPAAAEVEETPVPVEKAVLFDERLIAP